MRDEKMFKFKSRVKAGRAAFTMIELIFAVIAMAGIYMAAFEFEMAREKRVSREEAVSSFVTLVTKFIYDRNGGYVSDKGGVCSSDYSVLNISAYRVKECAEVAGFSLSELDATELGRVDGAMSYFGFLGSYAVDATAPLKIYIDDESDYEVKILVAATTDDKAVIEQMFGAAAQRELAPYFVSVYYNAVDLNDTTFAGNANDGIVRLHFKN